MTGRAVLPWLVHALTASGAFLAYLALVAIIRGDLRAAFLWLTATTVIDAVDGMLARLARVKERASLLDGARLDDIVDAVRAPAHLLARPYLRPIYDEPEFVVRNIWRLYGGWYDGDPSHLKPAPAARLAAELASLAGGAGRLAERAREVAASGDLRLAGHLAELAAQAAPGDKGVHEVRAEVFGARAKEEASTMSKGIFSWAEHESSELAR